MSQSKGFLGLTQATDISKHISWNIGATKMTSRNTVHNKKRLYIFWQKCHFFLSKIHLSVNHISMWSHPSLLSVNDTSMWPHTQSSLSEWHLNVTTHPVFYQWMTSQCDHTPSLLSVNDTSMWPHPQSSLSEWHLNVTTPQSSLSEWHLNVTTPQSSLSEWHLNVTTPLVFYQWMTSQCDHTPVFS